MAGAERRAASFFNISQNLGRIVKPRAGVERQDSRGGFLIVRAEAVLPAVSSVKVGVSLEDEVHLPGEPEARVLEMREHRFGIIGGRGGRGGPPPREGVCPPLPPALFAPAPPPAAVTPPQCTHTP